MDRNANLLNTIITADEISTKETLNLYHKEVEKSRKLMLIKAGTYVQPQLIVNVVSDTEDNRAVATLGAWGAIAPPPPIGIAPHQTSGKL